MRQYVLKREHIDKQKHAEIKHLVSEKKLYSSNKSLCLPYIQSELVLFMNLQTFSCIDELHLHVTGSSPNYVNMPDHFYHLPLSSNHHS